MNQDDIVKLAEEVEFTSREHFRMIYSKEGVSSIRPSVQLMRLRERVVLQELQVIVNIPVDIERKDQGIVYNEGADDGIRSFRKAIRARIYLKSIEKDEEPKG